MHQQATWSATASQNADLAVRGFGTAGWTSGEPQTAGMWFQFELPQPVTVAEIHFLSAPPFAPPNAPRRPVPYPRAYEVQVSLDGTTWSAPVAEGRGNGPATDIAFTPVRAKFVRSTQTATTENAPPWAMQQMQLYEVRPDRGTVGTSAR
jgi:hypothetical protein